MADLFCARNPNTNNFSLHFFLPSKHCSSLLVHSNNPRILNGIVIRRRRRSSPHLSVRCEASSQSPSQTKLDVISTHEHRDGSLVFRFWDPSEIAKNVEEEKPEISNEEDEDGTVQEAEDDAVDEADTEVSDHISPIVDSKSDSIVETESNSVTPISEASIEEAEVDTIASFDSEKEEQVENGLNEVVKISSSENAPLLESSEELIDDVVMDNDFSGTDFITADEDLEMDEQALLHGKTEYDVESEASDISAVGEEDLMSINGHVNGDDEAQTSYTKNEIKDEFVEDESENGLMETLEEWGIESIESSPEIKISKDTQETEEDLMLVESLTQNSSVGLEPNLDKETDEESKGIEVTQSSPAIEESNEETQETEEETDSLTQNSSVGLEPNLDEETDIDATEESKGVKSIQSIEESNEETQETEEGPMLVDILPQDSMAGSEITEEEDNGVLSIDPMQESRDAVAEIEPSESSIDSHEIASVRLVLSSGAAVLPHPSKVEGEDACFIAGQSWLGVADGASQWSFEGTNRGLYGLELMKSCQRLVSDSTTAADGPAELLSRAVAELQCHGSSTATVARLDGQVLRVANIGNSGFIIVRDGYVHVRSSPMLHAFHFPLQIGRGSDPCLLAENYRVDLEEGDVIVTSTDGLFDNLFDHEISAAVANSLDKDDKSPKEIAEVLARRAQEIGLSVSGRSPFSEEAQNNGFSGYEGGKLDDVAVIVSFVEKQL